MLDMVALARRRKIRRNCSPTENRCCGARIMPACSRPALIHCVGHVERVEHTVAFGSEGQLFLAGLLGQTGIHNRYHCETTRTKGRDQATMHRIFVEVELDLIHGCGSAPVLSFQNLSLAVLGCQVCVDFLLVGIVVGKSRMNLRQRQVTSERLYDLFWSLTHVVPLSDSMNGDTCPGNARPAAANLGAPRDQAAYLGDGCHRLRV
jgi:hypothetical protein